MKILLAIAFSTETNNMLVHWCFIKKTISFNLDDRDQFNVGTCIACVNGSSN